MKPLILDRTPNTPKIILNKEEKEFLFEGRSLPENTVKFFEPVMEWLAEYKKSPADITTVNMNFVYFNTSSAKLLLEVFKELNAVKEAGNEVKIIWHYMIEDYDIQEAGEEYSSMVDIPFEYVEHPEEDYEE